MLAIKAAASSTVPAAVTLLLLSRKDKHGFNWGQRVLIRFASARSKRHGSHLYRSGPLGRTPWGRYQLPGISARSRLWEAADSYGRPFALLHMPTTNHYTVVIECQPDGAALVDLGSHKLRGLSREEQVFELTERSLVLKPEPAPTPLDLPLPGPIAAATRGFFVGMAKV